MRQAKARQVLLSPLAEEERDFGRGANVTRGLREDPSVDDGAGSDLEHGTEDDLP